MGFLDKLFGKGNTEKTAPIDGTSVQRQEQWEFYFSNVDDKLGSIFVDLGLYGVAPILDKPNIIWVSVKMNSPTEAGLSSQEESKFLWSVENELVKNIYRQTRRYLYRTVDISWLQTFLLLSWRPHTL